MKLTTLSMILIMSLFTVSLLAVIRHVPGNYATIQAALDVSSASDTVSVAPGVYFENIVWPQVDGITLISTGNRENTIIDGNHAGMVLSIQSPWDAPVLTLATKVSGFTIRNGFGQMNGPGVCCRYASPTLSNMIIAFNSSEQMGSGGGLYCYAASPVVTNVIIVHNNAYSGGGVHIDPMSSPVFNHCVIADNTLYSPGGSYAAGVYGRYEVYFQLNQCTIARNRAWTTSAIHLGEVCTPTISHSTITDNYNGILIVTNGSVNLQSSNITENENYGLWLLNASPVTVQNNWWGSASGPYHATSNPNGTGETIVGSVDFSDWLTTPDFAAPLSPPKNLDHNDVGNYAIAVSWLNNTNIVPDSWDVNYGTDTLAVIHPNFINVNGVYNGGLISNLDAGTDYVIQVAAVKDNNRSWYSNRIIVRTTGTAVSDPVAPISLLGNYPNPFIGTTTIKYDLKKPGKATLRIYNMKGQLVQTLFDGYQVPGLQQVSWDGRNENNENVSSGVFFARLECEGQIMNSKLILMK